MVNNVLVLSTTTETASLQWMEVNGTEDVSYNVTWQPPDAGGMKLVNDTNVIVIDKLKSSTNYTFQVQALNSGGSGQMSESTSFPTGTHFSELLNPLTCKIGPSVSWVGTTLAILPTYCQPI